MEIIVAVLGYILHCFTAFALIFSCDKAKIWGDGEEINLVMPKLDDIEEEEMKTFDKTDSDDIWEHKQRINRSIMLANKKQRDKYIETVICPAHHYFLLSREIQWYQSDCDKGLSHGVFLQLFSIVLSAQMLIRAEVFDAWYVAILLVASICSASCYIIYLIYKHYWIAEGLRIKHFSPYGYDKRDNNYTIAKHYEYLCSIKETVYFRASVRKILFNASLIIYVLFFFSVPEY